MVIIGVGIRPLAPLIRVEAAFNASTGCRGRIFSFRRIPHQYIKGQLGDNGDANYPSVERLRLGQRSPYWGGDEQRRRKEQCAHLVLPMTSNGAPRKRPSL